MRIEGLPGSLRRSRVLCVGEGPNSGGAGGVGQTPPKAAGSPQASPGVVGQGGVLQAVLSANSTTPSGDGIGRLRGIGQTPPKAARSSQASLGGVWRADDQAKTEVWPALSSRCFRTVL